MQANRDKIIVLGGGYAGLAAIMTLREHCSRSAILLMDPGSAYIHRARLHERVRHSDTRWKIPFRDIEQRFRCQHLSAAIQFGADEIKEWQRTKCIKFGRQTLSFDYLIVTSGSRAKDLPALAGTLFPDDLAEWDMQALLQTKLGTCGKKETPWITVVGAGASGIQFLFELDAWRRKRQNSSGCHVGLRLVNAGQVILEAFPRQIREYVTQKILKAGIQYLDQTSLLSCQGDQICLLHRVTHQQQTLPSMLTLACLGLEPHPMRITTNAHGQIVLDDRPMEHVFSAGDCSVFAGTGANTLSAQVATRKGRLVAKNIIRHQLGLSLASYDYQEQGYFVSLGPADGVGWLGRPENVIAGLPAYFIKETLESLYDLSLL